MYNSSHKIIFIGLSVVCVFVIGKSTNVLLGLLSLLSMSSIYFGLYMQSNKATDTATIQAFLKFCLITVNVGLHFSMISGEF